MQENRKKKPHYWTKQVSFFHLYTVSAFINIVLSILLPNSDFSQKKEPKAKSCILLLSSVYTLMISFCFVIGLCMHMYSITREQRPEDIFVESGSLLPPAHEFQVQDSGLQARTERTFNCGAIIAGCSHYEWKIIKNNKRNIHWHLKNLEPPMAFHFCERDLAQKALYHRENKWADCA